jgi:hypothetical protein
VADAGASGAGGGDHGSTRRKGKTPIGPHEKSKKPEAWVRAQLHYLKKEHENMLQGARNLLWILRTY